MNIFLSINSFHWSSVDFHHKYEGENMQHKFKWNAKKMANTAAVSPLQNQKKKNKKKCLYQLTKLSILFEW